MVRWRSTGRACSPPSTATASSAGRSGAAKGARCRSTTTNAFPTMWASPTTAACCAHLSAGSRPISTGGGSSVPSARWSTTSICVPPSASSAMAGPTSTTSRCPTTGGGIFLAPPELDRRINFGIHKGQPAWQELPGEYRAELRRLIVVQGDTEPASVEQQRPLRPHRALALRPAQSLSGQCRRRPAPLGDGLPAASLFGRDGREEAEEMLARHAGDADKPRTLEAFNEPTDDWLSFFMYTFFQDRGRQVPALRARGIGLRPAVPHLPLHADRRSAPHVCRRIRHHAHRAADLREDARTRHRRCRALRGGAACAAAEVDQPPLLDLP